MVKIALRSNKGFTLVEMVVTVAVLAILIGISTPAIFEFMRQRDRQNEEIAQNEIRKAMQAYLADKGELPSDSGTGANVWYTQLAGYTNLSANQIQNDVWGRQRSYILYENTSRKLFGNNVRIYYASIHSKGANNKPENTVKTNGATNTVSGIGITTDGKDFAGSSNSDWWKSNSNPDVVVSNFSALQPGGDDVMTRFTNYSEMLDRYNVTIQRLDRLTQALETFARSGYAERVAWCSVAANAGNAKCTNGTPEKTIYYPKAAVSSPADTAAYYDDGTTPQFTVSTSSDDATRRTKMEDLMNKLGLPAEFCCSAMAISPNDKKPVPFYYFSNPRPRSSSGCGARPATADAKLPARITTTNDSNTCG